MGQKDYPVKDYTREPMRTPEEERTAGSKDFVMGALIGGLVGAAAALFMAPKPGKELRSDLNVQAKALTEKTEKLRQTAMEKGSGLAGTAKEKAKPVTDMVASKSADIVNKVKGLKQSQEDPDVKNTGTYESDLGDEEGTTGYNKAPVVAVEVNPEGAGVSENKSAAQAKLDETKKAFEETETKYSK